LVGSDPIHRVFEATGPPEGGHYKPARAGEISHNEILLDFPDSAA
jgi:hypothetical protein